MAKPKCVNCGSERFVLISTIEQDITLAEDRDTITSIEEGEALETEIKCRDCRTPID